LIAPVEILGEQAYFPNLAVVEESGGFAGMRESRDLSTVAGPPLCTEA
jgi:hypothetical protein